MKKVYFAKSNACSSYAVAGVRKYLKENPNVEVVEWDRSKGAYSNEPLIASDYLVILPEEFHHSKVSLGKGLYSQINTFLHTHSIENIFIITDASSLITKAHRLRSTKIVDNTNWARHAIAQLEDEAFEINSKISDSMRETYDSYGNRRIVDDYGREREDHNGWYQKTGRDREYEDFQRRLDEAKRLESIHRMKESEKVTPKAKAKAESVGAYLSGETVLDPEINRNVYLLIGA